jgi:hypothetical protein
MDCQIVTLDPLTNRVVWGLNSKTVTGISELLQIVVLSLLNVPGQDVLDPNVGGGLPSLIGENIDAENTTEIAAEVMRRVRKTQREVIAQQVGLDLPPESRLRDIQIISIKPGATDDTIDVRLRLINMAGRQTDVVL